MQTPEAGTVLVDKSTGWKYVVRRVEGQDVTLVRAVDHSTVLTVTATEVAEGFQPLLLE